jgi:hypothetical protein
MTWLALVLACTAPKSETSAPVGSCDPSSEVPYDGVDQDCDGADLVDVDLDGVDSVEVGGSDCDDSEPTVRPGAMEVPYDGIDQDCDGSDVVDVDGDGFVAVEASGDDCDDSDPYAHPGAEEVAGDGIDQDCDGVDAPYRDEDGDGFGVDDDCDDTDPSVYPGAPELCDDGIDHDCDGQSPAASVLGEGAVDVLDLPRITGPTGGSYWVVPLIGGGAPEAWVTTGAGVMRVGGSICDDTDLATASSLATLDSVESFDNFGRYHALTPDADSDGVADLWVSTAGYDDPAVDAGRSRPLWLFPGGTLGFATTNDALAMIVTDVGQLPTLATGDITGDGEADVVIGFEDYWNPVPEIRIEAGPFVGDRTSTYDGAYASSYGGSRPEVCDLDGDGANDLVVWGQSGYPYGHSVHGVMGPVPSGAFDVMGAPDWSLDEPFEPYTGAWPPRTWDISCARDTDGDGVVDMVAAMADYNSDSVSTSRVGVFHGVDLVGAVGFDAAFGTWSSEDLRPLSARGVGDLNADGEEDLLVHLQDHDYTNTATVWYGPFDGARAIEHGTTVIGVQGWSSRFGPLGDINGDGIDDAYIAETGVGVDVDGVAILLGGDL